MFEKTQQCFWCSAALSSKAVLLHEFPSSKPPVWECSVWIPIKQRMIFLSFGNGLYSVPVFTLGVTCLWEQFEASFLNFLDSAFAVFCHFCLVQKPMGWTHWPVSPTFNRGDKVPRVNVPQGSCKSLPGCQGMVSVGHPMSSGKDKICTEHVLSTHLHFLPQHLSLCVCPDLSDGSGGTQGRAEGPVLPNGWIRG